jgi:hypothetical protein
MRLRLDPPDDGEKDPTLDLSAAVRVGSTLFLGSDEGVAIERLRQDGAGWSDCGRVDLAECLGLTLDGEADIEGLAEDDGWLWVLGSHARTRPKLKKRDDERLDLKTFANLKDTRARCLVARLPLAPDAQDGTLLRPVDSVDGRRAQMLKPTKHGNALARTLERDPLIGPFTCIPAKEGGVDLEGIAVAFPRVALGMRGPVIQGYAVLLEMNLTAPGETLEIDGAVYKRMLDLEGLGIRDLKRVGSDLYILEAQRPRSMAPAPSTAGGAGSRNRRRTSTWFACTVPSGSSNSASVAATTTPRRSRSWGRGASGDCSSSATRPPPIGSTRRSERSCAISFRSATELGSAERP